MSSQSIKAAGSRGIDEVLLEKVRSGQRFIIYAILLNFLAGGFRGAGEPLGMLIVSIAALVLGIAGLFRMAAGFQYSGLIKILLLIALFIPLVNIVVLVVLSIRATKMLREAGFAVGLLGASKRAAD